MNKKTNTVLFILGATVFNILVTAISFLGLFVLYNFLLRPRLPEESFVFGSAFVFIAALALSFIIYQALLKLIIKKVEVNKYFEPLFGRQKK